ncbi:hypothetical protein V8E36_007285 [Tilletia maclaganii]
MADDAASAAILDSVAAMVTLQAAAQVEQELLAAQAAQRSIIPPHRPSSAPPGPPGKRTTLATNFDALIATARANAPPGGPASPRLSASGSLGLGRYHEPALPPRPPLLLTGAGALPAQQRIATPPPPPGRYGSVIEGLAQLSPDSQRQMIADLQDLSIDPQHALPPTFRGPYSSGLVAPYAFPPTSASFQPFAPLLHQPHGLIYASQPGTDPFLAHHAPTTATKRPRESPGTRRSMPPPAMRPHRAPSPSLGVGGGALAGPPRVSPYISGATSSSRVDVPCAQVLAKLRNCQMVHLWSLTQDGIK